jgi:uncharacterized coiled-coil protein SlyX
MKFLFVSIKKHERIVEDFKKNNKIINEERQRVTEKNIELQKEVKQLKEDIKQLKKNLAIRDELVAENDKIIDNLVKENDKFKKERDNAIRIQRSETRTRKSKKYKEMESIIKEKDEVIKEIDRIVGELQEDLDKTRKEYDELLTKRLQAEKECNCNHDDNNEEVELFIKEDSELTDEELANKINNAMKEEFPELPFTDIETPIKITTEVKHGVIRPIKKQPKNKGKRVNKANKNSKMNNKRKGGK